MIFVKEIAGLIVSVSHKLLRPRFRWNKRLFTTYATENTKLSGETYDTLCKRKNILKSLYQ